MMCTNTIADVFRHLERELKRGFTAAELREYALPKTVRDDIARAHSCLAYYLLQPDNQRKILGETMLDAFGSFEFYTADGCSFYETVSGRTILCGESGWGATQRAVLTCAQYKTVIGFIDSAVSGFRSHLRKTYGLTGPRRPSFRLALKVAFVAVIVACIVVGRIRRANATADRERTERIDQIRLEYAALVSEKDEN